MNISFARYLLHPIKGLSALANGDAREGALLKIEFPDGSEGYADLHPWPELGDQEVLRELEALKENRVSPLGRQSLALAKRDALARVKGKSLWLDEPRLPNNFLISDISDISPQFLERLAKAGFQTLKLKCGRDVANEARVVNLLAERGGFFLRLDFNSQGDESSWREFSRLLRPASDTHIEYIEDPAPYDVKLWSELQNRWKIAMDHEVAHGTSMTPAADVLILKPARQDVAETMAAALRWDLSVTVTSSMDHPVGVAHAYSLAQELKAKHGDRILTAGCMTTSLYHKDLFSEALPLRGAYMDRPAGFGVGFDDILAGLTWQTVSSL